MSNDLDSILSGREPAPVTEQEVTQIAEGEGPQETQVDGAEG